MNNPAVNQLIAEAAKQIATAKHGQNMAIYERLAVKLNKSTRTAINLVKKFVDKGTRKKRSDAGKFALSITDAQHISALLMLSLRNNNKKQLSSIELAVERLQAEGMINAVFINKETGEVKPLSTSAIINALYGYNLHPKQLLQPEPATRLASEHPNHVWQIDASICAQYYLDDNGLEKIDPSEYYDGKPENLKRIEKKRLQRYAITDHASGTIYAEYTLGSESAESLCNCLINAIQQRGKYPFYGVPKIIMTDPGAAMKSAIFRNLCRALGITLIINKVKNARAKGSVEKAHDLIECNFESGLKLRPASNLNDLNKLLHIWMHHYNTFKKHSRTGKSRYSVWQTITKEQLRLAPSADICRELAISQPLERKVNVYLTVSFRGHEYDVSQVPNVLVGEKLLITRNPWRDNDSAQVVLVNEDGREYFQVVERVNKNQYGFTDTAAIIGTNYKQFAENPAQQNIKQLDQLVTGTNNVEEAEQAKKAKQLPFKGAIDPFKTIKDTELPAFLPKQGSELETTIAIPTVIEVNLTLTAMAKQLKGLLGEWSPQHMAWLQKHYPQGAPENELNTIAERYKQRPILSVVGG